MGGVVEADQPRRVLGSEADLGSEPGPETLTAPSDLGCQPLDANLPVADRHLSPGEADLRVDRRACFDSLRQRGFGDREPVVPRCGRAQLLFHPPRVAPPEVIEGFDRSTQVGGSAQELVREHRGQANLQALDAPAAHANAVGREADDDDVALLPTTVVVDEQPIAEVDRDRDSRVRHHGKVDVVRAPFAEARHAEPRQQTGP
jgi:hypothetical protein